MILRAVCRLFVIAAIAIAGCSASTSSTPGGCIAVPLVAILPYQLAYPIPGSVGVPDSTTSIYVYTVDSPPSNTVILGTVGGAIVSSGVPQVAPSPYPSPMATPAVFPTAPALYAIKLGPLAPLTSYQVVETQQYGSGQCVQTATYTLGTFTSQ